MKHAVAVRGGDHALLARLRQVRDEAWFIADQDRATNQMEAQLAIVGFARTVFIHKTEHR